LVTGVKMRLFLQRTLSFPLDSLKNLIDKKTIKGNDRWQMSQFENRFPQRVIIRTTDYNLPGYRRLVGQTFRTQPTNQLPNCASFFQIPPPVRVMERETFLRIY